VPFRGKKILGLSLFLFIAYLVLGGVFSPAQANDDPSKLPTGDHPASSPAINLPATNLRFERIMPAHGLSFPTVRDVIQDHNGFMWFATANGLNKYNGYAFTVYKNNPRESSSLSSNDIKVLFEDSNAHLWVGGKDGLDKFDPQTETFVHINDSDQVFCIAEDSRGTVWVGFENGLYGYDPTHNLRVYGYPSQVDEGTPSETISPGDVQAIFEDSQGYLWIGTSTGLDQLDRNTGTFIHYTHDPEDNFSLISNNITAIYEDTQGDLWIGTQSNGIDRLNLASRTFKHFRFDAENPSAISSDSVLSILEDQSGNLWVGTVNGLNQYDRENNRFYHYRHDPKNADSLSDNIVNALFEDSSGVLWIATANGLSKYIPQANQFIYLRTGFEHLSGNPAANTDNADIDLSESKVLSIFEDQDSMIWFGTLLDGLYKFDPNTGEIKAYRHIPQDPKSINSNEVYAIYQDRVGVFWLGTGNGWLEQFDPQYRTTIHAYQQESQITSIIEDLSNNLWIGTQGQGLYHLKFEEQYLFESGKPADWIDRVSLISSIVETIYIDRHGTPWVGTYDNGINIWDYEIQRFASYTNNPSNPSSLSSDHVISILEDPDFESGVMWIGTMGGGLNRFDTVQETFTHYTVADGLGDDIINCILADDAGFLWLSTPKGLTRFDRQNETFRNYDSSDGVSGGTSHPGICLRSRSGEMYFGTPDGVIVFDPAYIVDNMAVPPIAITSLMVNDRVIENDILTNGEIKLSYWENYLSFEFAALDYTAPQKNNYAYQMEGLDNDWVSAGTRLRADYPDLRPGNYVFRVKGSNNDGVWNETGITYHITIVPPFWTTGWFLSLMAFLIGASIFIGSRFRLRGLEARSRELETQVQERTHEINRQRQQIEALYRADEDIYRHLELNRVLQALVDTAVQILQADKGSLWCWDEERKSLVIQASHGFDLERLEVFSIPRGNGVAGWVAEHGEPATIEDTTQDPRVTPHIIAAEGIRAFVQVPIKVGEEVFGVFSADYLETRSFSEDEVRLLVSLAQRAAMAIQNAQLYNQGRELAATQERNRLARELHDAVTQTLFSASLIAEALPALWERDTEKGRDRLVKLRQMSRGALAEMRALLLELRPTALLEANLDDLLRQLGEVVAGREGVPVKLEIENSCKLPEDLHIALYRIAQEAINNVVKHARPTQVTIGLRQTCHKDGYLQNVSLWIYDNGRGFDPLTVSPNHLGLNIMCERAQSVNATIQIESQPGQGTQIIVKWIAEDQHLLQRDESKAW